MDGTDTLQRINLNEELEVIQIPDYAKFPKARGKVLLGFLFIYLQDTPVMILKVKYP